MTEKEPTLGDALAHAYGEWQTAERDIKHADDPENHAYLTGQADAFRDMFIQLSTVVNPYFDFAKFCAIQATVDENFIVNAGELEEGDN
jgi:hypothetical protein